MSNQEHRDPQDSGEESAVRRAWRQASDELPPPELDAAINAAARRSTQDHGSGARTVPDRRRSRNWLMHWQPLAAAATVAGLAFILLQVMPRDRDVTPSIRLDETAPGPASTRPIAEEPAATERAAAAPTAADAAVAEQKASGELAGRPNDGATAGSGNAAADRAPAISAESDSSNMVAPALEKRQRDEASLSTADWAATILALYEAGDVAGAADSLRAFRAAYPDADTYLPESLHDWARTVN